MTIYPDSVVLFTGDSITDCGREKENPVANSGLGGGYAHLAASSLLNHVASPDLEIHNRGISGNRVYDLEERLEKDLIELNPDVVSILIGINDTWRRYDSDKLSPADEFKASYARILSAIREKLEADVILLEPFLLPVPEDRMAWREDLDPRITVVRELAVEFGTEYIALDGLFAEAATKAPAAHWLPDGVHPSLAGHSLIAEEWLDRVSFGEA